MPTIGDVLSASKNIDYTNAVVNAQGDKNIYKREIEKSIYTDIESKLPKTEKKDIFEQELLKIMTIQEYLKMMNIDQK
ncbi:TPA: hypothetical protein DEP21_03855 [Patescibacteria group bacterium]|nr:hypothetical protein [Candidatus Gracilibacteria bacterium]